LLSGNNSGQVVHTHVPLSSSSINWYQQKVGSKQATTRHTGPMSVVLQLWLDLAEGLESEISTEPTGSGPRTTLLTYIYFTNVRENRDSARIIGCHRHCRQKGKAFSTANVQLLNRRSASWVTGSMQEIFTN